MNGSGRRVDGGALVAGVILIGLGVVFFLDSFRFADFGDLIGRYWPLIIVMVGLPKLFHPHSMWSGMWIVAIGLWMQAANLHLYGLTWTNSWPLLLIALGAGTILRTLFDAAARRRRAAEIEGEQNGR